MKSQGLLKLVRLVLLALSLTGAGCNFKIEKLASPAPSDGTQSLPLDSVPVNFAVVMENVLRPRCLECHSDAGGNRGGVNLESYGEVMSNIEDIQADVESGTMPKRRPPLLPAERDLILNWIAAGAPEN